MNNSDNKITGWSKLLLALAGLCLTATLFVPLWRIDLEAPQYPEGLALLIYPHKIGGNVEIINGLNHYIGMKTLHTEDFIEFTLLPYIIGAFILFTIVVLIAGRKKGVYALLFSLLVFGIVAMYDFWQWEYNYGHNLDPNAAIIVPGMAYQPPLIGFKQLLNFGAYSIPDTGGWLFIIGGLFILFVAIVESHLLARKMRIKAALLVMAYFVAGFSSCTYGKPELIRLNKDNCDYCKMTISNLPFAAEIVTPKGRVYKFDDLECLFRYQKENFKNEKLQYYVSDFVTPHPMVISDSMFYIKGGKIESPMGGNIAAFSNADSAQAYLIISGGLPLTWNEIKK